jgi:hypothetical protein
VPPFILPSFLPTLPPFHKHAVSFFCAVPAALLKPPSQHVHTHTPVQPQTTPSTATHLERAPFTCFVRMLNQ